MNTIPFTIVYQGMLLRGYANPTKSLRDALPLSMRVYIQGWCIGTLSYVEGRWSIDQPIDTEFITALGKQIHSHLRYVKTAMSCTG